MRVVVLGRRSGKLTDWALHDLAPKELLWQWTAENVGLGKVKAVRSLVINFAV